MKEATTSIAPPPAADCPEPAAVAWKPIAFAPAYWLRARIKQSTTQPPRPPRKRRLKSKARRAFAWGLLGFVGLQLLLSLTIAGWKPELRDPLFWVKARQFEERIAASPDGDAVAFLGSSRTIHGIRGRLLEEELQGATGRRTIIGNLGVWGTGPITQLLHLQRLLERGVKPSLLVVEVLPPLFHDCATPEELSRLPARTLSWNDLQSVKRLSPTPADLQRDWWQAVLLPFSSHRFELLSGLYPSLLSPRNRVDWWRDADETGWLPLKGANMSPAQHASILEQTRRLWQPKLAQLDPGGKPCQALVELLTLARRENVPVVLVLMPEGPAMRSWYGANAIKELDDMLHECCRRFDARLIDAREWLPERGFRDSHHLYPDGARHLSARLARELRPLLR